MTAEKDTERNCFAVHRPGMNAGPKTAFRGEGS